MFWNLKTFLDDAGILALREMPAISLTAQLIKRYYWDEFVRLCKMYFANIKCDSADSAENDWNNSKP